MKGGFQAVYDDLSSTYDLAYGRSLGRGRRLAFRAMRIQPGMRVLEIGVGTGLSLGLYPRGTRVTAIDISQGMLSRARKRVEKQGLRDVELHAMSAERLEFEAASFDRVFAPSVLAATQDPEQAMAEMVRVCRPDGRICIVAHVSGRTRLSRLVDRLFDPFTRRFLGYRTTMPRSIIVDNPALELELSRDVFPFNFSTLYLLRPRAWRPPWPTGFAVLDPPRRSP